MEDFLPYIAGFITLIFLGLAAVIVIDRGRIGWRRAQQEQLEQQRRQKELSVRIDQLQRVIAEQKSEVAAAERKIAEAEEEVAAIQKQLDAKELPFLYTAVPLDSGDMYAQSWRFIARHGSLGADQPEHEPAAQWTIGRMYVVAAPNQAEARSLVDRLLPRHRGFTVTTIGEGRSS